jgi:hypothetical protein
MYRAGSRIIDLLPIPGDHFDIRQQRHLVASRFPAFLTQRDRLSDQRNWVKRRSIPRVNTTPAKAV